MIKLDALDLKILKVLQREGRITKVKLAEAVNLSPSPCWTRLQRLEQAGVITGYHARVNLDTLARPTTILVEISLRSHKLEDFRRFEAAVKAQPEIVECWSVGGGVDYFLKVVTRDVDAYQRLVDRLLMDEVGIDRYFTYVVTKPVKNSPELPLDAVLDPEPVASGPDL